MKLREMFNLAWQQLTGKQKTMVIIFGVFIFFLMLAGWVDSAYSTIKVKVAEHNAEKAKKKADEALEKASQIASQIKEKEAELSVLENKRDEKRTEVEQANKQVIDAQSNYDRTVTESIKQTPSTDELCADLASLGYPCR